MLKLISIKKDYHVGDFTVNALKGVDLSFREHEFVAILGHSGCGKTTLLNIIGGLDQYSSGDLVINGKSTKKFSDSDWDTYRNNSIGFVFQSYNLIPHQTVLANVELAMTLSGVGASERRERAVEALEKVGLGDQIHKKPNQLSGGQMQRVAIARALVNNPDILLADEPTGALDSDTSVQIMEILKEIAKDKLIIMVTHNPELATGYASRIIRLKDGLIVGDSDPFDAQDTATDTPLGKKTSMGFFTALSLSLNNLMTKKTRTLLTAFAGSIGIIGIALIMSLSNGIQNYIDKVQEDTLSSYPITIQAESVDMTAMMASLMGAQAESASYRHENDAVYSSNVLYTLVNSVFNTEVESNNLRAFRSYIEAEDSEIAQYISSVQYSYDVDITPYAEDPNGHIAKTDAVQILQTAMSATFGGDYTAYFSTYGQMYSNFNVWQEMLPGENGELINPLLTEQYEMVYGRWPESYNEVVLIVNENNEVSDLVLYSLGLKTNDSIAENMQALVSAETLDTSVESWSYEEICGKSFRYIYPADQYQYNEETGEYIDLTQEELGLRTLYNNGLEIRIVGIIRKNNDALSGMLTGSVGYTHALVEHIAAESAEKDLIRRQLADPEHDVFTGLPYLDKEDEAMTKSRKVEAAKDYIANATTDELAELYIVYMSEPDEEYLQQIIDEQMEGTSREDIEQTILEYYPEYASMLSQMDDDMLNSYMSQMIGEQARSQYADQMQAMYRELTPEELAEDFGLLSLEEDDYLWIYENAMPPVFATGSLKDTLKKLGYVDLDSPSVINIYASSFEAKDNISVAIEHYNESVPEEDQISYTDVVALLMSSITTIINVISYVLIAFVAISLVVSSIMIGIITYISVLERRKEIGILRAMGASKRNITEVFNAETFIIGLLAGAFGIALTLLLQIPINQIIRALAEQDGIRAFLPPGAGITLIILCILLTFIGGFIPSRKAARQDPVAALRSE